MAAPALLIETALAPAELTPEQALENARALYGKILSEAAATEERNFYSEDLHLAFVEAGFYHMFRPKMFGGYEFSPWAFFNVIREIARADMSTAWSLTYASGHAHQVASFFPESVQRAVFADGHFGATYTGTPSGTAKRVEGGWQVDAIAPFSSGGAWSTHFVGKCFVEQVDGPPILSQYIVPRELVTIRDDWGRVSGLRGSASHTVEIAGAVVPDEWVLVGVDISTYDPADGTPGFLLHGNPLYGGRPGAFFAFEPASILIGGVAGAFDELTKQMPTKPAPRSNGVMRSEHPRFQAWWADAAADIAVATAALKQGCESWDSVALRSTTGGAPFSVLEDIEIQRLVKRGQSLAWSTLEQNIMKGLGTAGVISGGHAERVWRDATTIHTHLATLNNDFKGLEYAALVFGVEDEVVTH